MNVACWNVWGLNSPLRQKEVRALVQENGIGLLGLVETRVSSVNSKVIETNLLGGWHSINNYSNHPNGRIRVLWNPEVLDVSILHSSEQLLHVSVTILEQQIVFSASFVYGFNTPEEWLSLWDDIKQLSSNDPWILLGDFNVVRFLSEKVGGDLSWPPHMDYLNNCCYENKLDDLKA